MIRLMISHLPRKFGPTDTFAYAKKLQISAHADRGLNFISSLHLHPHFVYVGSEGSGESANMHRLASAFVA